MSGPKVIVLIIAAVLVFAGSALSLDSTPPITDGLPLALIGFGLGAYIVKDFVP